MLRYTELKTIEGTQMKNLLETVELLKLESNISVKDMPDLDLYMDQVIQLFEKHFKETMRNDEEKVLTKTMINNYAKGKLLLPIKNKKYSKEHLILISLIYQFKGTLSIGDIKKVLGPMLNNSEEDQQDLEALYTSYLELYQSNLEKFKASLQHHQSKIEDELNQAENEQIDYSTHFLLIASLVNMSQFYRRTAEKLIDQLQE